MFADSAYAKAARKAALRGRGGCGGLMSRARRGHPLSKSQRKRNNLISCVRQAVARVIGTLKRRYEMADVVIRA